MQAEETEGREAGVAGVMGRGEGKNDRVVTRTTPGPWALR